MFVSKKYQNKKIAIYGMGITGFSAAQTFKKLNAKIFCWDDDRKKRKKVKKLNLQLNKFWKNKFLLDYIVISPGIDINKSKISKFLKKNSKKIITDLDIFFELNPDVTTISITGTNGKSTTCKIIESILKTAGHKVKTLGNIGDPILSFRHPQKKSFLVIEVSSYQLQYSKSFRSNHAAILNISPDHLERHKNIKNYTKIKSKIFFAQTSEDYSYINFSNKYSKLIKNIHKQKRLKSKLILVKEFNPSSLLKKINNSYLESKGNIENLTFAYKIAKNLNISDKIIIKALNQFKGLPHRQEVVFFKKGILCINDSKATSFDASIQSLLNYKNIYWIVGGLPKRQDYFYLKNIKKKIVKAYIIGKNALFFEKKIKKDVQYKISKSVKNAVNSIYKDLKLDKSFKKTILFSPAAASFDQFSNFENRGNYFKKFITKKFM